MKRFLLIVAGLLVVVLILAAVILPRFIDPERYRPQIERMLSSMTGRSVSIGPMRLHVFPLPGITADGFSLSEDAEFGKEPFLKAARLDARVRLMPLFASKLDIVSFDIQEPVAHLHRDGKGRWNVASLMKQAGGGTPPAGQTPASGGGLDILVEKFRLVDGSVDVVDDEVVAGTPVKLAASDIQATISDLSTTSPVGIALKLSLAGSGSASVDGRLGPPPKGEGSGWPVDAHVKVANFAGGAAAPYVARTTGMRLAGGSLDLDVTIKGTALKDLAVNGTLALSALQLAPAGGTAKPSLPLDGSIAIDATLGPADAHIRKADLRLGKASVAVTGAVTEMTGSPKADLRAVASKVAFKDVVPLISLLGPLLPEGLATKGEISLDATARGAVDDPRAMAIGGTATLSGFEFSDPSLKQPIKDAGGTLLLSQDRAELKSLSASLGRTRLAGTCVITHFAKPVLDVDLTVPLLDVDEILSFMPAGGGGAPAPSGAAGTTAPSSMLRDVTVRGQLAVNEAKAMNLKLTAARAQIAMANGEARLQGIQARLYGGTLDGDVTAGLADAGPPFAMKAKIQNVDFNGLCADFSKDMAGVIHGTLETSLDVKGRGLDTQGLRSQLVGGASLALRHGSLTSFGFLKQAAAALAAVGGRGIGKDETPFDSLTGTFDIRQGRATTQDLRLVSPELGINGKGSIGLDMSVAMNVGIVLSPQATSELLAKAGQLSALANNKGELTVDMTVGGTLQKPSIGVDPNMLRRAAEQTLKKKGGDLLRRLLEKRP